MNFSYRFRHWFFQWLLDDDGDIALRVCGFMNLVKYKEHTFVRLSRAKWRNAPKYIKDSP